jgi:hypothetical protein
MDDFVPLHAEAQKLEPESLSADSRRPLGVEAFGLPVRRRVCRSGWLTPITFNPQASCDARASFTQPAFARPAGTTEPPVRPQPCAMRPSSLVR